jgi:Mg-chelatase subunit ChlD
MDTVLAFSNAFHFEISTHSFLDEFEDQVEKVQAQGSTRLFDALRVAAEQLREFQVEHPQAKLRIVCLTDGEDTVSSEVGHLWLC